MSRDMALAQDDLADRYCDQNQASRSFDAPNAEFELLARRVNGRFAFRHWLAVSDRFNAVDGADSFVIEDGLIVFQSIHYRLVQTPLGAEASSEHTKS